MRPLATALAVLCLCAASAGAEVDLRSYPGEGYRNGRKLTLQLVTIGWASVELRTARAFLSMRDAAAEAGVDLAIRSGFRDLETQSWLYDAWRAGVGNKAARPGYSYYQSGRALDLYIDAETFAWLERHARRFGFRRTVRGEPWHWEYTPVRARRSAARRRPSG